MIFPKSGIQVIYITSCFSLCIPTSCKAGRWEGEPRVATYFSYMFPKNLLSLYLTLIYHILRFLLFLFLSFLPPLFSVFALPPVQSNVSTKCHLLFLCCFQWGWGLCQTLFSDPALSAPPLRIMAPSRPRTNFRTQTRTKEHARSHQTLGRRWTKTLF